MARLQPNTPSTQLLKTKVNRFEQVSQDWNSVSVAQRLEPSEVITQISYVSKSESDTYEPPSRLPNTMCPMVILYLSLPYSCSRCADMIVVLQLICPPKTGRLPSKLLAIGGRGGTCPDDQDMWLHFLI